ncbi:HNH endonuclease [Microbacterium sp. CFH 31415]|jgi:hypothetical protein|uniref:HNH endonuclease signature motif containing protein n=1 Tax=Microbacterium sp. CFH 31415 TaxID=2921732 RepID=UPI001F13CCEB|nr:HNH endonuclease signature motif containing protein [Microbacterium sp. CFH 31415]MCH6230930.1 HNH endonuclease [Microbacterium sp. CFH 31415]
MSIASVAAAERAAARMAHLVPRLVETRREMSRLQAEEAELLAQARSIADDWTTDAGLDATSTAEFPHRSVAAEIAVAWRVSDRTVQRQMNDAATLVDEYPETHAALASGTITAAHARAIVTTGQIIQRSELRAEFEASVLDYAMSESAARLTPIARRRAEWFADVTIDERHRLARSGRRVWVEDLDDGMGELHVVAPAFLVHAAHDRLSQLGHAVKGQPAADAAPGDIADGTADDAESPVDARNADQLRADILLDLLLAADPVGHDTELGAIRASVSITVPVLALIDAAVRDPFEAIMLDGHAPVDIDTARMLTADAPGWDRILTHPITGAVVAVDRYRPSEEMRRHLRVRDQHCRFPGCRMPTRRCDADHTIDFALGGETTIENLANLCRRHHTLKHQTAWTVVQRSGGVLEWTSPTGSTYADRPVSTVAFAPDPECDHELAPF